MASTTVEVDLDSPIIFRTTSENVYNNTIETGSIWLRSSDYYRDIEDQARKDCSEGVNTTKTNFPLRFNPETGPALSLKGSGSIGCEIVPHYIMSMHGTNISEECRKDFGGYTIGIRCLKELSEDIFSQASKQINVDRYRYGQVSYQSTALTVSLNGNGSAICLGGEPSVHIKSIDTDVLRKEPVEPFISQDEWRIVIFPLDYVGGNPDEPLKINVNPNHFYEYIKPETSVK